VNAMELNDLLHDCYALSSDIDDHAATLRCLGAYEAREEALRDGEYHRLLMALNELEYASRVLRAEIQRLDMSR